MVAGVPQPSLAMLRLSSQHPSVLMVSTLPQGLVTPLCASGMSIQRLHILPVKVRMSVSSTYLFHLKVQQFCFTLVTPTSYHTVHPAIPLSLPHCTTHTQPHHTYYSKSHHNRFDICHVIVFVIHQATNTGCWSLRGRRMGSAWPQLARPDRFIFGILKLESR